MNLLRRWLLNESVLKFLLFLTGVSSICAHSSQGQTRSQALPDIDQILDLPLDDLFNVRVQTSSKRLEKSFESPGVITVFTGEEIALFGANNLFEALSRIVGVLPQFTTFVANNIVSIRGDRPTPTYNHTLVLLDGVPISRESYNGAFNQAIFYSFPLTAIDRIEVVRGPGSVLYGANAFAGVINIITKKTGKPLTTEVRYGTFSSRGVRAFSNLQTESQDLRVTSALHYFATDGWDLTANATDGAISDRVHENGNLGITSNIQYKDLLLSTFLGHTDLFTWRIPSIGNQGYLRNTKFTTDLSYDLYLPGKWKVTPHISHVLGSTFLLLRTSPSQPIGPPTPENHYTTNDSRGEITLEGPITPALNLLAGAVTNWLHGSISGITTPPEGIWWSQIWWGLYSQLDYRLNDTFKFIAGGQLNKVPNLDASFVPRLGTIINFTSNFGLKALYSEAFRAPLPGETIVNTSVIISNPNVTFETVGTYDLQVFYFQPTYQLALSYFHSKQDNIIRRVPLTSPFLTYGNTSPLFIDGVEFESKVIPMPSLFFSGNITYQQNHDTFGNKDVMTTPHWTAKVGVGYTFRALKLGVFNSFISAYPDNSVVYPNRVVVNPAASSFDLLTANLSFNLVKPKVFGVILSDMKFSLYGTNLLDSTYYVPEFGLGFINTIPGGPGRAVYASVEATF